MKKSIFCIFLYFLTGNVLQAQVARPVKWAFEAKRTAYNEYDLIFKATMGKKWHVFSQYLEREDGPIKTTFTFTPSDGYIVIGKVEELSKGITSYDKSFDMKVKYFEKEAIFVQHIKLTSNIKSISGTLNYMTCDDSKCLPPQDVDFVFYVEFQNLIAPK